MTLVYIIAPNVLEPYLGPSVVAHNLLKGFVKIESELKKHDIEITFVSLTPDGSRGTVEVSDMVKVVNVRRIPPITFTGEIQALLNSRKLETPDVVHSHDLYELFPWIVRKTPTVYTPHGIFWKEKLFSRGMYMGIYYELAERRLRWYYKKLAKLVAISPYVVRELLSMGFDVNKVEIIENPVSDEFFSVKKQEENLMLYPAALRPLKNQLTFLKALILIKEELEDIEVVFAGSGDPEYSRVLQSFVQQHELRNIRFLGAVEYPKMLELYSKASIVALVSHQETQPMAVLESMATGTPVLASDIIQNRYIITQSKTGMLVSPHDSESIAECLKVLVEDNALRKKLGKNAKREAERRWNGEGVSKKLLKLYLGVG